MHTRLFAKHCKGEHMQLRKGNLASLRTVHMQPFCSLQEGQMVAHMPPLRTGCLPPLSGCYGCLSQWSD